PALPDVIRTTTKNKRKNTPDKIKKRLFFAFIFSTPYLLYLRVNLLFYKIIYGYTMFIRQFNSLYKIVTKMHLFRNILLKYVLDNIQSNNEYSEHSFHDYSN